MNTKTRRATVVILLALGVAVWLISSPTNYQPEIVEAETPASGTLATDILERLKVAQPASHDGYTREQFSNGWADIDGCDARNVILARDLTDIVLDGCLVMSGRLADPYTGAVIQFTRGATTSSAVQIDHVVALSNAWETGAKELEQSDRKSLANDPLNLLAVDGPANQQKSDQDASEWLPPNKAFHCQYVARQISVKFKYILWVTEPEKEAMVEVLSTCPNEPALGVEE